MRISFRTLGLLALALVLLGLFLRNADLHQVWADMRRAQPGLLLLALATMGVNLAVRSVRWQYLLRPLGRVGFFNAMWTTAAGFAASTLLPARAGEVLRPYLLARAEGLKATSTFATIIVERLLDTVTVLLLFAAYVVFFDPGMGTVGGRVYGAVKLGGLAAAGVAVVALAVLFVLAGRPDRLGQLALRIERVVPPRIAQAVARASETFAEGLAVIRQPRRLFIALMLSLPLWLSIALGIWAVADAFRLQIPFTGTFLMMTLLVVGVAVPTPGSVGGFHEAFRIGATTFYGATNDGAIGAAIVLHALSFVPVTILGILLTAGQGMDLGGMRHLAEQAREEGEPREVSVLRTPGR